MIDRELFQKAFEALEDMMQEFRKYDLPYGSKAYAKAKDARLYLYARLSKPEQEPVAWRTFDGEGDYDYRNYDMNENYADEWNKTHPKHKGWGEPLYTALPTQRKPLTDDQIMEMYNEPRSDAEMIEFARAIEAAHGIKEEQ